MIESYLLVGANCFHDDEYYNLKDGKFEYSNVFSLSLINLANNDGFFQNKTRSINMILSANAGNAECVQAQWDITVQIEGSTTICGVFIDIPFSCAKAQFTVKAVNSTDGCSVNTIKEWLKKAIKDAYWSKVSSGFDAMKGEGVITVIPYKSDKTNVSSTKNADGSYVYNEDDFKNVCGLNIKCVSYNV